MKMTVCAHGLWDAWAQDDLHCICKVHLKILHTEYPCISNKLISTLYVSKITLLCDLQITMKTDLKGQAFSPRSYREETNHSLQLQL